MLRTINTLKTLGYCFFFFVFFAQSLSVAPLSLIHQVSQRRSDSVSLNQRHRFGSPNPSSRANRAGIPTHPPPDPLVSHHKQIFDKSTPNGLYQPFPSQRTTHACRAATLLLRSPLSLTTLKNAHRAPSSALAPRVELISIKTTRGSLATRKMSGSGFTKVFNSAGISCRGTIDVNSYRSINPVARSFDRTDRQTDRQTVKGVCLLTC